MTSSEPILIVGGGLVGASLAIALDNAGLPAILVEAAAPRVDDQPSYDERNLALARATVNGLTAIGVWDFAQDRATPITHIHTSRAGDLGSVRMDAAAEGVDALGWTLPARELGAALLRRLDRCRLLTRLAPARVEGIEAVDGGWSVAVSTAGGRGTSSRRSWWAQTEPSRASVPSSASAPASMTMNRRSSSAR